MPTESQYKSQISSEADAPLFFNSSVGLKLTIQQVIQTISDFIDADPMRQYKIIVGTDSELRQENKADFVTAIVIHRVGNGGRYFWHSSQYSSIKSLRQRIWQEVLLSLDVSKALVTLLKNAGLAHCDFEIHVDVGENGETRSMIQELVTAIRANNFEPKTKPDSYAASKVADRHI